LYNGACPYFCDFFQFSDIFVIYCIFCRIVQTFVIFFYISTISPVDFTNKKARHIAENGLS